MKDLKSAKSARPRQPHRTCAIIIPIYRWPLTRMDALSVDKTTQVLCNHDIYMVGPPWLHQVAPQSLNGADIHLETFDAAFFRSTKTYNKLLMSPAFFKTFAAYDYMLIAQTDTLTFRDDLEQWCAAGYDYIGAPWIEWVKEPTEPGPFPHLRMKGVGNGGYSLRSIPRALQTLTDFRHAPFTEWGRSRSTLWNLLNKIEHEYILARTTGPLRTRINEDLFWGKVAPKINQDYRLAPTEDAIRFAFEAAPETLYDLNKQQLPSGCHAFELYNLPFWKSVLGETYFDLPNEIATQLTIG
ncbi:DUF5672 family protein [Shimia sp. FJ5]|uniref:DUF5672 family protein n=1 Tax=Shimia sp. FJ5 TaxID=3079054 RepID=UPI002608ED37|nr:DUF5672 family protein [Shimia sp. FJ5]MDV4145479.1 DUF5672 family protein [Shimia sp. FJ5]